MALRVENQRTSIVSSEKNETPLVVPPKKEKWKNAHTTEPKKKNRVSLCDLLPQKKRNVPCATSSLMANAAVALWLWNDGFFNLLEVLTDFPGKKCMCALRRLSCPSGKQPGDDPVQRFFAWNAWCFMSNIDYLGFSRPRTRRIHTSLWHRSRIFLELVVSEKPNTVHQGWKCRKRKYP